MTANDGTIYVNYANTSNVEEALAHATSAIGTVFSELQEAIQPLRASWDGSSEDAYQSAMRQWQNDMNDMQTFLSQYNAKLSEMAYNYGSTDNDLAMQWSEIG